MSCSQSRDTCSCFLHADEAVAVEAVEAAVRTAVMSILKLFSDVNHKKCQRYEEKLAETQRENAALKLQLNAAEHELQTFRQVTSTSGDYKISAEVTFSHDFSTDADEEGEEAACSPWLSESGAASGMKEEPRHESTPCIKSELPDDARAVQEDYPAVEHVDTCLQRCGACNSVQHSLHPDPALTRLERRRLTSNEKVRRYRERIRADPEKYLAWKEKNRLRYLQKKKTINDLSEPMKNLKREAWREATRRHRARKLEQTTPQHP